MEGVLARTECPVAGRSSRAAGFRPVAASDALAVSNKLRALPAAAGRARECAPEGIRTPNLLIRSQMLYPLSYGRVAIQLSPGEPGVAEARGFEPPVPVKGQLISSESHSAALARLLEPSGRGTGPFEPPSRKATGGWGRTAKRLVNQRRWLSNQSNIRVCESMNSSASSSSAPGWSARCSRPG